MFTPVFTFELNYHLRQRLFYILCSVFFLLTFLATTSPNVSMGPNFNNANINAPIAVISTLASASILALFGAVAFVASGVVRDFEQKTAELFFTTRVRKADYIYGRFFGALLFSFGIYFSAGLGVFVGELMPWLDQERIGAISFEAYWFASWAIVLPNIFTASCIFFCLATVTRNMMYTYVAAIALLMLTFVIGSFDEPETIELVSKIEPFGLTALGEQMRYWTVFEKNELIPVVEGNLLFNRILWLAIGLAFLALSYVLFPFSIEKVRFGKKKSQATSTEPEEQPVFANQLELPNVNPHFDTRAQFSQYLAQSRFEIRNIVWSAPFIVLLLFGLLNVIGGAAGSIENRFGTPVYPTSATLISIINGTLAFSLLGVLVYYSAEIMLKERSVNFSEITDSLPYPNWVMMAAKLTALIMVVIMMLLVAMCAAFGVQIYHNYYEFNVLTYLTGLLFFFQFPLYFMCVLSVFFFVMTRSRYMTMFLMVLYAVSLIALPQLGFEQYLYRLDKPGVAYSDFTGYSHLLTPYLWFTLYWSLWGLLLLIATHLLWPRGAEFTIKTAIAVAKQRVTPTVRSLAAATVVALVTTGGYIYYNTNILNEHISNLDFEELQADYEKKYKQYQHLPQPDVIDLYTEVDIYPKEREVRTRATYQLKNLTGQAIDSIHFTHPPLIEINQLDVPDSTLTHDDDRFGYRIYDLDKPLAPGEEINVAVETSWLTPGFRNSGASMKLTDNGTFFNNQDVLPLIGYQSNGELQDNNKRRKFDLEPVQRMRPIEDEAGKLVTNFGGSIRTNFETVVSTSSDQIAIAPGYLQKQWTENDRAYFHYKMDEPIWNFFSFISGDYQVKKDSHNDVAIEVAYQHDYNVDRMIYAVKQSLDYFESNFTPYQYRQFKIIEFPRYQGAFAQSFPNTIPFSEAIGFTADLRDKSHIDYVFYVTAHELAHQWWAHQVLGADVQGQTMIVETLAQYFALMVMEEEYGKDKMKQFLEFELDRYLRDRGGELIEELPISLVENQQYIHYRKGSVVLYALQDYIGKEKINAALRSFLHKYAFKSAPYPTTQDLIAEIRLAAGPEYSALITDMLEKIVLFDLKVDKVTVAENSDGQYDVTMTVAIKKFEADGEGRETPVDASGLFDIALLGEKDDETKLHDVIQIEKRMISDATTTITISTATKPYAVGIDPFNKLIDRNPDDNIKTIDFRSAAERGRFH
ncbi:MAG: hypothetical protein HOC70_11390 [Gammaproteobacteria bacterium]|jgi:ABC-2 type transport system permease protein|nr:hypothetical protein [Gammaproteobacteria bacterium]